MGRKVKADPRLAKLRAEQPDIGEAGRVCLEAAQALESERPVIAVPLGMAGSVTTSGAVPWRAVDAWCARRGLGRRETEVVAAVLRRLDLDHARREAERVRRAAESKG
jgi:hypothetical protein